MKKSLIIFSFLFLAFSLQAQLQIGIKGGGNFSYVQSDTPAGAVGFDWEALTSYHLGAFAQLNLNEKMSLRGELLYSFEGAEARNIISSDEKLELTYLNMPLLVRFQLFSGLYLDLGVEPGVIINNDNKFIFNKDAEIGALAGVGFRLGERLEMFARYVHGLTDIYDGINMTDGEGNDVGQDSGKARLWQIGAGFYIFK